MNVKDWVICLIEPNKFEAQIMIDLLRNAGVGFDKIKHAPSSDLAVNLLETFGANIIIGAIEMGPVDGVAWTKAFRRNNQVRNRKAPIFLTSHAFSRATAEDCRHAGVNALIGKPISAKILIATINKILANPRPFIDAAGYVGPCRRAGIVTAGEPKKRRKADESAANGNAPTMQNVIASLARAVSELLDGKGSVDACEAALRPLQAGAMNASDGPMMRACAAFTLQLQNRNMKPDAAREALEACVAGVKDLAALDVAKTAERDALAEGVRQAVAKAATRRAA